MYCDSSPARQLAKKKGVSSIRHLHLKLLFVQRLLENKQFDLKPIAGLKNPSDILTKAVDRQTLERYFVILGLAILPDGGENVVQRAASVASSTSWSAIARIAVMLGSLPAVKCTEVEPVEKGLLIVLHGVRDDHGDDVVFWFLAGTCDEAGEGDKEN